MTLTPELMVTVEACFRAGKAILETLRQGPSIITTKDDGSLLTNADKAAHDLILRSLSVTALPVLSEEGPTVSYEERKHWPHYWLVDPLDGTTEFLSGNGDFTVNIALVEGNEPVLGVIYAPFEDVLYYGSRETGAYRVDSACTPSALSTLLRPVEKSTDTQESRISRVLVSRSHCNDMTVRYVEMLRKQYPEIEIIQKGSSLKLCLVASGEADLYPRFGTTMEWDTAAGHAIMNAVGKKLIEPFNGKELSYNKEDLKNPSFIAR